MKSKSLLAIGLNLALILTLVCGCSLTRLSTKRNRITERSMENARRNNTLANRALERQPFTNRTAHTEVARVATEQNEKILGAPIKDIEINKALHTNSTNYEGIRDEVYVNLARDFDAQDDTEARKRDLAARLEEQGRLRVEEHKEKVALRWKWGIRIGIVVLILAGIIAACVYFPPLIVAIVGAFRTAKAATSAMRNTTVGIQKAFEVLPAEHGAKLATILEAEQDKPDKAMVDDLKVEALKSGEINTIAVPKFPPPSKPPHLSPEPGHGPESPADDTTKPKGKK